MISGSSGFSGRTTLADRISGPVLEFVQRHTTVSIERTVLRLMGFHDAGPGGVPFVNLMVDELHRRRLTGRLNQLS